MTAPERIWAWEYDGTKGQEGHWRGSAVTGSREYIRADIAAADLARVTAELKVTDYLLLAETQLSLDRLARAEAAEAERDGLLAENAEHSAARDRQFNLVYAFKALAEAAEGKVARLVGALEEVVQWGPFPSSGRFWPTNDTTSEPSPMSYSAAFGSNGERDYIRARARAALSDIKEGG